MKEELLMHIGGEGGGLKYYKIYLDKYTFYYKSSRGMDEDLEETLNFTSPFYHSFEDLWQSQDNANFYFVASEPEFIHDSIIPNMQYIYKNAKKYSSDSKDFRSVWDKFLK